MPMDQARSPEIVEGAICTGSKKRYYVALAALGLLLFLVLLPIKHYSYFGDEGFHYGQIEMFLRHDYRVSGSLTTIPGFHFVIALVAEAVGEKSLSFLRFINIFISLAAVAAFHSASRLLDERSALAKTAQLAFLPILFPFFILLYTDVFSLFWILLGTMLVLRKSYIASVLVGMASIFVRQNNVVWMVLLFSITVWDSGIIGWLWARLPYLRQYIKAVTVPPLFHDAKWRPILASILFLATFAGFVAFMAFNGGIALGDQEAHPFPSVHLGNIYFFLGLFGILLLPYHLFRWREIVGLFRNKIWAIPLMVAVFTIYMLTFTSTHGYNQDLHSVFLRNRMLVYFTMDPLNKVVFFLPVGLGLASILSTSMQHKIFLLIWPLTILYLLPSWLIEQRYYFIPLALFLLFRKPMRQWKEWVCVAYSTVMTGVIYVIVASRYLFL